MSYTRYNITVPKKYIKDGVEKTTWQNVGTLTEFQKQDGSVSRLIEIPAIGLEAQAFPFKEREEAPRAHSLSSGVTEEIDPNDVPF